MVSPAVSSQTGKTPVACDHQEKKLKKLEEGVRKLLSVWWTGGGRGAVTE